MRCRPGEVRAPSVVSLDGQELQVPTAPLGAGSYNQVFALPKRRVLRASLDYHPPKPEEVLKARHDHAVMKVFSQAGVHPPLEAESIDPNRSPFALSLMKREVSLYDYLLGRGSAEGADRMARSLWHKFCVLADAGMCLTDVKPENALCDPEHDSCYLIDIDGAVFEDPELLDSLGCDRFRGACMLIMALLFYCHLRDIHKTHPSQRIVVFLDVFRSRLAKSCMPLSQHPKLDPGSLFSSLAKDYRNYFDAAREMPLTEAYRAFRERSLGLMRKDCASGAVVVNGARYAGDGAGCFGATSRSLALRTFGARSSRCQLKTGAAYPYDVFDIDTNWKVSMQLATEKKKLPVAMHALSVLRFTCTKPKS